MTDGLNRIIFHDVLKNWNHFFFLVTISLKSGTVKKVMIAAKMKMNRGQSFPHQQHRKSKAKRNGFKT